MTETKQKQRLTMHSMDKVWGPFAIKKWGFVYTVGQSLINWPLWTGAHCREVK